MTNQERPQVAKMLLAYSKIYNRQLEKDTLSLMLDLLNDLTQEQISRALERYSSDPKNRTFPLPAQIRAIANPASDPDAEAKEAASRITSAVSQFGFYNTKGAREYIGELGWHIVQRWGGWEYICTNLGVSLDITTFQAQTRDIAKATIARNDYGMHDKPPQLGAPAEKNNLQRLDNLTNGIGLLNRGNDGNNGKK